MEKRHHPEAYHGSEFEEYGLFFDGHFVGTAAGIRAVDVAAGNLSGQDAVDDPPRIGQWHDYHADTALSVPALCPQIAARIGRQRRSSGKSADLGADRGIIGLMIGIGERREGA